MTSKDDEAVIAALKAKDAFAPCQRCKRTNFGLVGYTPLPLKADPHDMDLAGTGTGAAVIMCRHCGCLNLHSTVVLGVVEGTAEPTSA